MTEYLVFGDGPRGRIWVGDRRDWEEKKSRAAKWGSRRGADNFAAFLNGQKSDDGYTFRVVEVHS